MANWVGLVAREQLPRSGQRRTQRRSEFHEGSSVHLRFNRRHANVAFTFLQKRYVTHPRRAVNATSWTKPQSQQTIRVFAFERTRTGSPFRTRGYLSGTPSS